LGSYPLLCGHGRDEGRYQIGHFVAAEILCPVTEEKVPEGKIIHAVAFVAAKGNLLEVLN